MNFGLIGSLFLTLSGVIAGWLLQILTSELRERREIRRSVSTAAASRLGRLKKIAMEASKDHVYVDEKAFSGGDSDRFLQAVSRRKKVRRHEISVYKRMSAVLLEVIPEKEFDNFLAELIDDPERMIVYAA